MSPILGLRCETRRGTDKAETPEIGVVVAILSDQLYTILVLYPDGSMKKYPVGSVTMLEQPTRQLNTGRGS